MAIRARRPPSSRTRVQLDIVGTAQPCVGRNFGPISKQGFFKKENSPVGDHILPVLQAVLGHGARLVDDVPRLVLVPVHRLPRLGGDAFYTNPSSTFLSLSAQRPATLRVGSAQF